MYAKTITYDRQTKDFAAYLNGELIGYFPNHLQAENELNRIVYETLSRQSTASISDLDADDAAIMLELKAEEARAGVDYFDALEGVAAITPSFDDAMLDYSVEREAHHQAGLAVYRTQLAHAFPNAHRPIVINTKRRAYTAAHAVKAKKAA